MEITQTHYKTLQDKIFKIVPLFEQENEGLTSYISSLIYEFKGLRVYLNDQQDSMMLTIISRLEHFYDDSLAPSPDLDLIRSEWHNSMSLIDKMRECGETHG